MKSKSRSLYRESEMGGRFLCVPILGLALACSGAHETDAGVAEDAFSFDGSIRTDLGQCLNDDRTVCGCIGGFRRCDTCDEECPFGFACHSLARVCRGRERADFSDACLFNTGSQPSDDPGGIYCATGMTCAVPSSVSGTPGDPFEGVCMPTPFCLSLSAASPPLSTEPMCVYSDGTLVQRGPPAGECPPGDARQPFCGGACGEASLCPSVQQGIRVPEYQHCVGVSESRSVGVCTFPRRRCVPGHQAYNAGLISACSSFFDEPCTCLVTSGQPVEQGFVVLASVCSRYIEHVRDGSRCEDAHWE